MKLSWLFNGTMQAHHLAAAYVIVWVIQGGYAIWVALRLRALGRILEPPPPAVEPKRR